MWVLKMRLREENDIFTSRAEKHGITLTAYPLNGYKKGKSHYLMCAGLVFGEKKRAAAYFKDLKKDKRVVKLEVNKNFFTVLTRRPVSWRFDAFYNPSLIPLKPVIADKFGDEYWNVASWDKKAIDDLIKVSEKFYREPPMLTRKKIDNISVLAVLPELTENQKKAIELAIKHGYYDCPRKIKLEELARKMGLAFSTYQVHLRKAEKKLIPFIMRQI